MPDILSTGHARRKTIATCLGSGSLAVTAVAVAARLGGIVPTDSSALFATLVTVICLAMSATAFLLYWLGRDDRPFPAMLLMGTACSVLPLLSGAALMPQGNSNGFWCLVALSLMSGIGSAVWAGLVASVEVQRPLQTNISPITADVTTLATPAMVDSSVFETLASEQPIAAAPVAGQPVMQQPSASEQPMTEVAIATDLTDFTDLSDSCAEVRNIFEDRTIEQQITRRVDAEGVCVELLARVQFLSGQRQQSLHLPLTPAFLETPDVECESLGTLPVELTVATVYPYGIRLDVRRESATGFAEAVVGLNIRGQVAVEKAA